MASINKVILIGRMGRDADMRYTADGKPVASFSIATTETWKDNRGDKQERTEWHSVTSWGKQAEFVNEYIKKGSLVYIEGRIQSREYTGRDGTTKKHYGIEAATVQILSRPGDQGSRKPEENRSEDGFTREIDDDVAL